MKNRILLITCLLTIFPAALSVHGYDEAAEADWMQAVDENWPEVRALLKEKFPAALEHYREVERSNPEEALYLREKFYETYLEYREIGRSSPEMAEAFFEAFKLEVSSRHVGEKIRKARFHGDLEDPGQQAQIAEAEAKLREMLEKILEIRLEVQRRELRFLKRELTKLQTLLEQRESQKETIIERRFLELTTGEDVLGW